MAEQAISRRPALAAAPPSRLSRLYGLGSVFGKTLRDARVVVPVVGLLLGGIIVGAASQIAIEFGTVEARQALVQQMMLLPPLFHGLLGEPINIEALPGFVSWRVMGTMPLMLAIWSIIALSGTLAGEAARGTLEMVLATPVSRRRLAVQKYAAHAVALTGALLIAALLTWLGTIGFATLEGDEAGLTAVLSEFGHVLVMSLLFGTVAFALGPWLGQRLAAGAAAAAAFGSYIINGYAELVPGFDVARIVSPFYWTTQHRPMAGVSDWPALLLVAGLLALLAVVGVVLFERRDLAGTVSLTSRRGSTGQASRWFRWSLAGPGRRALAERLPDAIGWGVGLGAYGAFIALSAQEFSRILDSLPQIRQIIERFYPGVDIGTGGGILQLSMFGFATLIIGLAAATLVHGWASDETDRRLEILLATPLQRFNWALRSGGAVILAVLLMSLVMAAGTSLGVLAMGDPIGGPVSGALVIGLYAAALIGVGLLVAGLGFPRFAGVVVGGLVIGFYVLDFVGSALRLPEDLLNLALVRHLGQPMVGIYNEVGMLACALIAVGGVVLGALAFQRRDLAG